MGKKTFEQPKVDSDTIAELSAKLIESNNKLKAAERERTMMLENISHDLRAPLTAIRSTIDYLREKCDEGRFDLSESETTQMVSLLDSRARTLEDLISDLYYLTCLESGRESLRLERLPIARFLEEFFFAVEIDDKYAGYNLSLEVPDDLGCFVNIDVAKISRVLDNLFTNARKYPDEGSGIVLGAYEENGFVSFYIKDNGQGIPAEDIPFIFERTYRVSSARTPSKESSSGLGLSIARNIVEQHGGEIRCESVYGEGSTFFVRLPIVSAS